MKCPKCSAQMEVVDYHAIQVDRCSRCRGIWFDWLEAEKLKAIKGSESIDIGDPAVGKKYNQVDQIKCPKCRVLMGKIVDNDQPHIWYETCDQCYGIFFDAGEFKDYKEVGVADFFRDLLTRTRF